MALAGKTSAGFVSWPEKCALTWENRVMALGMAQIQQGFQDPREILGDRLREGSLYRLLADHGQVMFPDDYFADLYTGSARAGRRSRPG
jgi:hypothetical protein